MSFCQSHWDLLREKVLASTLREHVAMSAMALAEKTVDGSKDPLIETHNDLLAQAVEKFGMTIIVDDLCPVCKLDNTEIIDATVQRIEGEWINDYPTQ